MKKVLVALASLTVLVAPAASGDELFSGGQSWVKRFGDFTFNSTDITVDRGDAAAGGVHAEAQRMAMIGADFEYSADITLGEDAEAHLQFRISDDGRYGVLLGTRRVLIYRFQRIPYLSMTPSRGCAPGQPGAFTHCPQWSEDAARTQVQQNPHANWTPLDAPVFDPFHACAPPGGRPVQPGSTNHLTIAVRGASIRVTLNGAVCDAALPNPAMTVGRFGIYAHGSEAGVRTVKFANVRAAADPGALTNFALLYSTVGYEALGVKRALVRTLTDVADTLVDPQASTFRLIDQHGSVVKTGPLRRLRGKTFGMQLWEADFSDVVAKGIYRFEAIVAVPGARHTLKSYGFDIQSRLITNRVLKLMSIANAEARRGADDDFWRNWIRESGSWSVGVDGAFVAERADAGAGATLVRVFNTDNFPLDQIRAKNFRLVGRVTIVTGCDAQLRFEGADRTWWAVTLQAGAAGGCAHGSGPGAVRVSQEGPGVPHGFQARHAEFFSGARPPFQIGHAYDVEILVRDNELLVFVDQPQGSTANPFLRFNGVTARSGRFGIKAWASTARFEDVQAWRDTVQFEPLPAGSVRIPTFLNDDHGVVRQVPCQYAPRDCPDGKCRNPRHDPNDTNDPNRDEAWNACNPLFGQLHGFHDANSNVAEATSHGAFLSGLMQVWKRRASGFTQVERESLRRAIVANVLYLETLMMESGTRGQFAHSEMGRVEVQVNGPYSTIYGLYGLSDFAADGFWVDRDLANRACDESIEAAKWLWPREPEPILASIVYTRIARCEERQGHNASAYWTAALSAANAVITLFSGADGFRDQDRGWSRVVPWFEGVYELTRYRPKDTTDFATRLGPVAATLVTHLLDDHRCGPTTPQSSGLCPANGFEVVPQSSGDATKRHNWQNMDAVPHSEQRSTPQGPGWYNVNGHFPTSTVDAILLTRITGHQRLARLAAGGLYWGLGLNPGLPATKIARDVSDGTVWRAASFIRGIDVPFALGHQGFRLESYSSKGWIDWWEDRFDAPRREAWRIDPQSRFSVEPQRAFLTFVNGHVIWDGQWDYWNSGGPGWQSGETFIMSDGAFLKAALLFEDWLDGTEALDRSPYRNDKVTFFDTSHFDRRGMWSFDDPDRTLFGHASRAVHEFCSARGFAGGRLTGHVVGERVGALCVAASSSFYDVETSPGEAPWDINTGRWAAVARKATEFCEARSFAAGFFTGHHSYGRHGIVCLPRDAAVSTLDAKPQEIGASRFHFDSVDTVPWAHAARTATNVCLARGFAGGFPTGRQTNRDVGIVCLAP